MEGLLDKSLSPKQLSNNKQYDELVGSLGAQAEPLIANEEPTESEMAHFYDLYSDYMDELLGPQEKNVVKVMRSAKELYQGVAKAAFTVLQAVHMRAEQRDGPVPPAALFAEGGMIHSAVDEAFKMAQINNLPGSDSQDQYTASQMEMQRLVGEYLEKKQDDNAVDEAQELMIDIETYDGAGDGTPLSPEERARLEKAANAPTSPAAKVSSKANERQVMAEEAAGLLPPGAVQ